MQRSIQKFARPRMGVLLIVVSALALLTTPTAASTAGGIVIRGPESVSHLKLTVSGENLVVNGTLDPSEQAGCNFTHGQNALVCPLAGVSRIEVNMGPEDDKVEVLEPLQIPLTTHLGDGSDKFIGNDEPDTCYPEGTANNSCEGGGGDDSCITGPEDTKCSGGSGNDSCKMGAGSDGCFGGPGDDTCKMGAGEDSCHGEAGNDRLYGEADSDNLSGGGGNDNISGGGGNDRLYGGPNPDQLYGESGNDYCNGGPGVGRSHSCESGPGH